MEQGKVECLKEHCLVFVEPHHGNRIHHAVEDSPCDRQAYVSAPSTIKEPLDKLLDNECLHRVCEALNPVKVGKGRTC